MMEQQDIQDCVAFLQSRGADVQSTDTAVGVFVGEGSFICVVLTEYQVRDFAHRHRSYHKGLALPKVESQTQAQ